MSAWSCPASSMPCRGRKSIRSYRPRNPRPPSRPDRNNPRVMISKFFIERPVLANVLAVLMVVIGAVSLLRLSVAQYPNVVPPTISVTTRYPGASARAVVDTVALPVERQVNGADGLTHMQSYSACDGSSTLIVTFYIGTDSTCAQRRLPG